MKALFIGGHLHNTSKDIEFANPEISDQVSGNKEFYSLIAVKNKDGVIYAIYQNKIFTSYQQNEILSKF